MSFSPKKLNTLRIYDVNYLEIFHMEKATCVPPNTFSVKVTNNWKYVDANLVHYRINTTKWIYDWTLMLLESFREPLLSFQ